MQIEICKSVSVFPLHPPRSRTYKLRKEIILTVSVAHVCRQDRQIVIYTIYSLFALISYRNINIFIQGLIHLSYLSNYRESYH